MRFISKVFEFIVAHVYMRIISIFHFVCDFLADILIDLIVCQLVLLILCVDNKKSSNNDLFVSFKNRYILLFCLRCCFDYTSVTLQWDASRMSLYMKSLTLVPHGVPVPGEGSCLRLVY